MNDAIEIWEQPTPKELYMIAGWHQWADAGDVSSGLPEYLISHTHARKIGEIKSGGFYLFQIPGTHHLIRPEIKLENGYRKSLTSTHNEFYYSGNEKTGLVIFLGEEPHLNEERYTEAFLDAIEMLQVRRVAAIGGVYGAMPYDKDREISCVYSLPRMQRDLEQYAVKFSQYEGGATIGVYIAGKAEQRGIELADFYAFVPNYDFAEVTASLQGLRIERDYRAWYDLMHRFNHMFNLGLNLSDLRKRSESLTVSMAAKVDELDRELPQLEVKQFMKQLAEEFQEHPFLPFDDIWERELGHLLDDEDDQSTD